MTTLSPFKLERYFAEYEFKIKYLLSPSDCESLTLRDLLDLADADSLRLWESLSLGYTESQGHPLLRAEIAKFYRTISAGNVLVAAPEEAIFVAMNTLLQPGDHVVVMTPSYQSLSEIARANGCEVTPWPVTLGLNGWRLALDDLGRCLTDRTRLLVVNFPHNPTGYLPSHDELKALIAIARQRGLMIFCDEMYRCLEYDPAQRLPPLCDLYERGVSLSGLSKAFALPGLRLGWLAAQDSSLIERWLTFKDYTTICNSAPGEILGLIALRAFEQIAVRNLDILNTNLKTAEQFFNHYHDQFLWLRPQAGSVAFPQWLGTTSVEQFCHDMLERYEVMIVPGSLFDFPGNHFRVGLGRRNFTEALGRVGDYLA